MGFHVYPDPPLEGLAVAASATSPPVPFEDPSPPGQPIFIRCALFGRDCSAPSAPSPDVLVVADGIETHVTSVNGVDPTPVAGGRAFATTFPEARGVLRVQIFKDAGNPIAWQLRFRNRAAEPVQLMWVVADTLAGSQQPWITVRSSSWVLIDARPGEQVTAALELANLGTGPLTVATGLDASDPPGLRISDAPQLPPNSCDTVQLTLTGQPEPSSHLLLDWVLPCDDTAAVNAWDEQREERPSHTARVELWVTSHPRMPRLNHGDIVVMDARQMIRVDPATGLQTLVASGGRLAWEWDVAFERSGNLLFTAWDALVRMDRQSGSLQVVSEGGSLGDPRSMIVTADGSVLVVHTGDGSITRVHPETGAQDHVLPPGSTEGGAIAMAPDGLIYMAADDSNVLRIHLATRTATPVFHLQGFQLDGVAVAPDGSVFVAGNSFFHEHHVILRVDPSSGAATTIFDQPDILVRRLLVTPSGAVLVTASPWPPPDPGAPRSGLLLRLTPATDGGQWNTTPVSVGGLMWGGSGLALVPPAG